MSDRNFYEEFSEETQLKLDLLAKYVESCLPVFLMTDRITKVRVIDFFCGPGGDEQSNDGSPLKIVKIVDKFMDGNLKEKMGNGRIELLFNDKEKQHIKDLSKRISNLSCHHETRDFVKLESKEFKVLFNKIKHELSSSANFIFLDQFGIKEITKEIFTELFEFSQTDFMFFISSSAVKRFYDEDGFKSIWWMNAELIDTTKRKDIHRIIAREYEQIAPKNAYVIPFSIKKKNNIFRLIFCAKNILAADKFLRTAWGENIINGEANFDIDEDRQGNLLKQTKIEAFSIELEEKLKSEELTSNIDVFKHTISNGFIGKHARDVVQNLKNKDIIDYEGQHPKISYDSCIKKKDKVIFKVKNGNPLSH